MSNDGQKRNYVWLMHIAVWVVLFGMPFFSPRPGHPLHGGVNYLRFIPTLISFLVVFYVNYLLLIKKYLFTKKFWHFILANALLVVIVIALVHLTFKFVYPLPQEPPRPPRPMGPGPMRPMPPMARRSVLDTLSFLSRNTLIYIAIICTAIALRMTGRWYKDENKRREMENARAEAELAALKSQINPHFLFNTLNNIYSLIAIDQDKAQEAVHDLSGMMRYVLYESEQQMVPLSREVTFIKDYIKLMSIRIPKDVRLEVNLPEECSGRQIAPMLLIPLVENAFKHGVSSDGSASMIRVDLKEEEDGISCMVENTCFPKDDTDRSGSGIGIKNLCRRLDMLYPGKYSFEYGKVQNLYRSLLKVNTSETTSE